MKKIKIAYVGACGYGNIGDDIYPRIWKYEFPYINWTFYNSDLPDSLPDDTDLVLFGGGGIIYFNDTAHFEYMSWYIKEAKRLDIPFAFISADFQFKRKKEDKNEFDTEETLDKWCPILKAAEVVHLRSLNSVKLLAEREVKSTYTPDLAYLWRPLSPYLKVDDSFSPQLPNSSRKDITIIATTDFFRPTNQLFMNKLRAKIKQLGNVSRLNLINMGASGLEDERSIKLKEALEKDGTTNLNLCLSDDLTPDSALQIINNSAFVFSGRYHGMILSRNCGVPYFVREDEPQYKIHSEEAMPLTRDPFNNILVLRELISQL